MVVGGDCKTGSTGYYGGWHALCSDHSKALCECVFYMFGFASKARASEIVRRESNVVSPCSPPESYEHMFACFRRNRGCYRVAQPGPSRLDTPIRWYSRFAPEEAAPVMDLGESRFHRLDAPRRIGLRQSQAFRASASRRRGMLDWPDFWEATDVGLAVRPIVGLASDASLRGREVLLHDETDHRCGRDAARGGLPPRRAPRV